MTVCLGDNLRGRQLDIAVKLSSKSLRFEGMRRELDPGPDANFRLHSLKSNFGIRKLRPDCCCRTQRRVR